MSSKQENAASTADSKTIEPTIALPTPAANIAAPPPAANSNAEHLHGTRLALVMTSMMLSVFLVAIDQTILATSLPALASEFNAFSQSGWAASAFTLTQTGTILSFGQLLRIHKAKWTNLASMAVFELGSLICGVAPSMIAFVFGRAIAGVGAAGMFASLITTMAQVTPLHVRPKVMGVFGAVFGVSSIVGPLLGGAFTDHVTWRWCFLINLPIGAVAAAATLFLLPASPPLGSAGKDRSNKTLFHETLNIDWIGGVLFFGATTALSLALNWGGNTRPWRDASVIALLVLAPVVWTMFTFWIRYKGEKALLPVSIFKSFSIYAILVFSFVTRFTMLLGIYYLPLYYQAVRRDSATNSGIALLALMLSTVVFVIISGQLVARIGRYWPLLIIGPILQAVGGGLLYTIAPGSSNGGLIGIQICLGIGIGLTLQNCNLAMQAEFDSPAEKRLIAQASGAAMCAQFLGGTIGLSVGQAAFASELARNLARYAPTAPAHVVANDPLAIYDLAADIIPDAVFAYTRALRIVFIVIVPAAGLALASAFFIKNIKIESPFKAKPAGDDAVEKQETRDSVTEEKA